MDEHAASLASLHAVSPSCTRCSRASKITLNRGLMRPIYETAILMTIIPLRHGDSLYFLPMFSSLSRDMHEQVTSRHNSMQGNNNSDSIYTPVVLYTPSLD